MKQFYKKKKINKKRHKHSEPPPASILEPDRLFIFYDVMTLACQDFNRIAQKEFPVS